MTSLWENREVPMRRVDREIMWGNTKKSGIYTTHPKHFGENFRGTDWHWYDVNDCWCFADEWLGKPVKVDVYGAGDEKRGYTKYAPDALHPKTTVTSGVLEDECRALMQEFFARKR